MVHQTIFSIAFPLTNTFCTVMVYQHKSLSVVGDLHNLKGLCGHFNATQHLKIQKASNSRTLDPWKWSQAETLCAHPASQFFPGILHCSLWDMSSQDNHIITHSCHQTRPSQWIPPSLDKSSLCSRSHQEVSGPYSVTATLTFINMLQFPCTSPFVNPFINESTTEKHTDVPHTQCPAGSAADLSCFAMLQLSQMEMGETGEQYSF